MFSSTIKNLFLLALAGSAIALPLDTNVDKRDPKIPIGIGISFKYPFKAATAAADGAAVEKREKDAISFRYPIFDVADGTTTQGDVEKRDKDAISFTYPIFKVAEGADGGDVEKREPKSPYADTIAAADPRDILG